MTTRQIFAPVRLKRRKSSNRTAASTFKGREDHDILIQFDPRAADEIRDRRRHSSQQITCLLDGGCQLRLRLSSFKEIEGWVLRFGVRAKVLEPQTLADRVLNTAKSLVASYS
jgi:predicted DNA-binding transcriptional regulator YafY